jgi:hypothetical protein
MPLPDESGRYRPALTHAGARPRARGRREVGRKWAMHWHRRLTGDSEWVGAMWWFLIGPCVVVIVTNHFLSFGVQKIAKITNFIPIPP